MQNWTKSFFLLALTLPQAALNFADETPPENKQALATSPQALVDMLSDSAFLAPAEYTATLIKERGEHAFPIGLQQLPQYLPAAEDPREPTEPETKKLVSV